MNASCSSMPFERSRASGSRPGGRGRPHRRVPRGTRSSCCARTTSSRWRFPEEYGGTGTGFLTHLRAVEELSWADATVGLVLAVQGLGGLPVLLAGTEEQKQAYVPRWASGEWIAAYALTEPAAGSDAQALGTRARRDG